MEYKFEISKWQANRSDYELQNNVKNHARDEEKDLSEVVTSFLDFRRTADIEGNKRESGPVEWSSLDYKKATIASILHIFPES